jgi:hypothetical protein
MFRLSAIAVACGSFLVLSGCGGSEKLIAVSGNVTLDGKPVEGATVSFVSEDGKSTYSGASDASGNFSLQTGDKVGAVTGSYKVLVTKSPYKPTAEAPDPKGMQKMEEKDKSGPKMPTPGMPMPGKGGATTPGAKSDLPGIYGSAMTTPLTAKVPSDGPVKLELKSDAKAKP